MSLDNLGEFTNRGSETQTATVTTEPPPTGAPAPEAGQQQSAAPAPPPTLQPTPEPKPEVTPSKPETFMADILKTFKETVPNDTQPPIQEPKRPTEKRESPTDGKQPETTKRDEYGLPEA